MSKYEFLLSLVAIFCIAWVFKEAIISRRQGKRHRCKGRHGGNAEEDLQAESDAAAGQLKAMEKRIKVLEKIITDRETDLRDKFRDLENKRDE